MANIFIFYGVGGNNKENWLPWLKEQLENLGHKVFIPDFPTPENQTLDNWFKTFEDYKDNLNKDSILIGHSLGASFILNVLEKYPVKAAFLVAGFASLPDNKFKEGMRTFVDRKFNWAKIKNNCKKFYIFHSDNDPYVPIEKAYEFKKNADGELIIVEGAGHFNASAGYNKFELLFKKIVDLEK